MRVLYAVLAAAVVLMCVVSFHQHPPAYGREIAAIYSAQAAAHGTTAAAAMHTAASGSTSAYAGLGDASECQNGTDAHDP
jgi:hypothetical protein